MQDCFTGGLVCQHGQMECEVGSDLVRQHKVGHHHKQNARLTATWHVPSLWRDPTSCPSLTARDSRLSRLWNGSPGFPDSPAETEAWKLAMTTTPRPSGNSSGADLMGFDGIQWDPMGPLLASVWSRHFDCELLALFEEKFGGYFSGKCI